MASSPSQYVERFYTSEKHLREEFGARARAGAFAGESAREARQWQSRARRKFATLLGLHLMQSCDPRPRRRGIEHVDGVVRESWIMQTEPEVWMPFYLIYKDVGSAAPRPLVICPHGHGSAGKWATGGRRDIPAMRPIIETYNYDYGVQLARAGFITACPDARGFGERREPAMQNDTANPDHLAASSCFQLNLSAVPLGRCVQGMWTWDLMRLVDLLVEDQRVDAARIGCAGLSGGGLQTLDLAALDTRIQAAVVSGYFYGVLESLLVLNSNCSCNMVPHLWEHFDMGDLGGLVAPRGLFIETGDQDPLNGKSKLANVRSQVQLARRIYAALETPVEKLEHHVFKGEHLWNGTRAIPWLGRQLGLNSPA